MSKQKEVVKKLREKTGDELLKEVEDDAGEIQKKLVDRHFGDSVKSHELQLLRVTRARKLTIITEKGKK